MKQENDTELLANIRKSNKQAFDILFRKYYVLLCRYALKLSGSEEMSEEAVQEIFIILWEQRQELNVTRSVPAYLFQSVRNKVYENFRKGRTRTKYEEEIVHHLTEADDHEDKLFDDYELATLIWQAVEQLPGKCREIFQLSRDEGLTYNEIAEHLRISPKTVENQMGIAFKKLREILLPVVKSSFLSASQREYLITYILALSGM